MLIALLLSQASPDALASLYSKATIQKLSTILGPCQSSAQEFFSPAPPVPRDRLSNDLVKTCAFVMGPVLKKPLVPTDLDSLWFGIRQNWPMNDLIVAKFHTRHYDIVWVDDESSLKLYVRDTENGQRPLDKDGIDELVKQEAVDLLQLPPNWSRTFKFNTAEVKSDGPSIWYGSSYDPTDKPSRTGTYAYHPGWFNNVNFFTDGITTCLSVSSGRVGGQAASKEHTSRIGAG